MTIEYTCHENENYAVQVFNQKYKTSHYTMHQCYGLVNKFTGVVEAYYGTLPEAIHASEHLNMTLQEKPWNWRNDEEEEVTIEEIIGSESTH